MRLLVLRNTLFDFDALAIPQLTDRHASVHVSYQMAARAEQAACFQTIGFFGRLAELAGGKGVVTQLKSRAWEGDPITEFTVDWEPPDELGRR